MTTTLLAEPFITGAGVRNAIAIVTLAGGIFFMFLGALGVLRFPDVYARIHAASKCTTLGFTGMLIAACLHLADPKAVALAVITIVFTFVATPIGSHLLAKAAHHGKADMWPGTLSDELADDKADPTAAASDELIGVADADEALQLPLNAREPRASDEAREHTTV